MAETPEFNLKDNIDTKEELEVKQDIDKWKNRRKMAYYSLYSITITLLVVGFLLVFFPKIIESYPKIETTVITVILGWFSIIALYFGASSLADTFGSKIK